jgi:isoamylase
LRPDGGEMTETDWQFPDARFLAYLLNGPRQLLLVMLNAHHEALTFAIPKPADGDAWRILINTALSDGMTGHAEVPEPQCSVPARSVMVMTRVVA